jgi:hypothetical protein
VTKKEKTYYLGCYIKKNEKKAWSLGQRRQARGYNAVDQGIMLFRLELRREASRKRLFCEIQVILYQTSEVRLFLSKLSDSEAQTRTTCEIFPSSILGMS